MVVQEYRLFTLASSGIIDSAARGRFATDEAACDHARRLANGAPVEVWKGASKIAMLYPTGRLVTSH